MPPASNAILIVENNADDLFFMNRALKRIGVVLPAEQVCPDGEEACQYLAGDGKYADRTKYPLPALVFLDLKMPRKNGHEVLEWWQRRENLKHIRIVTLTTSNNEGDRRTALEFGATAYLVKPLGVEELAKLLQPFIDSIASNV